MAGLIGIIPTLFFAMMHGDIFARENMQRIIAVWLKIA